MSNEVAIKVENLSKSYKLYNNSMDRLKEGLNLLGKKYHNDFFALNDISFEVNKGESLGIVGKNGSGKSTLLKIITGVLSASNGIVEVNGKVSALLELGAGFNAELTGIQNIYLNGTIMGYSRKEMEERIDSIIEFADIGEFIHQPVKTYSSGMFVRLAFSVAINVDPDILIVDEALSVGDARFQQKCLRKIKEFKEKKTVLFVSHDVSAISKFCDRAIWLNEGNVVKSGQAEKICDEYMAFVLYGANMSSYDRDSIDIKNNYNLQIDPLDDGINTFGNDEARIIGANFIDHFTRKKTSRIRAGDRVELVVNIIANKRIENPILGFIIKDRLGEVIVNSNTEYCENLPAFEEGENCVFSWVFEFPKLKEGIYNIDLAIANGFVENHIQNCWVNDALIIDVEKFKPYNTQGLLFVDVEFSKIY